MFSDFSKSGVGNAKLFQNAKKTEGFDQVFLPLVSEISSYLSLLELPKASVGFCATTYHCQGDSQFLLLSKGRLQSTWHSTRKGFCSSFWQPKISVLRQLCITREMDKGQRQVFFFPGWFFFGLCREDSPRNLLKMATLLPGCQGSFERLFVCLFVCLSVCLFVCLFVNNVFGRFRNEGMTLNSFVDKRHLSWHVRC